LETSASLHITQKGVEELEHRTYKLSTRKRSVLILLDKPQTLAQLTQRSVFREQIVEEVATLVREGFIALPGSVDPAGTRSAGPVSIAPEAAADGLHLEEEVVLSEAKFQLVDFCVDSFGTQSQTFVDEIRTCRSARDLDVYLRRIVAATRKSCPQRLDLLTSLVKEINETA